MLNELCHTTISAHCQTHTQRIVCVRSMKKWNENNNNIKRRMKIQHGVNNLWESQLEFMWISRMAAVAKWREMKTGIIITTRQQPQPQQQTMCKAGSLFFLQWISIRSVFVSPAWLTGAHNHSLTHSLRKVIYQAQQFKNTWDFHTIKTKHSSCSLRYLTLAFVIQLSGNRMKKNV